MSMMFFGSQSAVRAAMEREQSRLQLQVLGASVEEIDRYERMAVAFAQRTLDLNSAVVDAAMRVGRQRLAKGDALMPTDGRAWGWELLTEHHAIWPTDTDEAILLRATWKARTWQALGELVLAEA